jgi:hypothetical protein
MNEFKVVGKTVNLLVKDIKPYKNNAKIHTKEQIDVLCHSLGIAYMQPIVVDENNVIIAGHGRLEAIKKNLTEDSLVECIQLDHLTEEKKKELRLLDNTSSAMTGLDENLLKEEIESLKLSGEDVKFLEAFSKENVEEVIPKEQHVGRGKLRDKFIEPPFSVFNARLGEWIPRKKMWRDAGVEKFLGRDAELTHHEIKFKPMKELTSMFDPVLCELLVKWFSNKGDTVFDPFSGGAVRGVVSGVFGRRYVGVDIRAEQIEANFKTLKAWGDIESAPSWVLGDGTDEQNYTKDNDFIITCPPYFNLEVYSDMDTDLSNLKSYEQFLDKYQEAVKNCVNSLKDNRFICWVVGNFRVRDKERIVDFRGDTIRAFERSGATLYNSAVLCPQLGTAAVRASRMFSGNRKLVPVHQYVLVFCKGDSVKASERLGEVDVDLNFEVDEEELGIEEDIQE